jgi:carboxypeptidase family protein
MPLKMYKLGLAVVGLVLVFHFCAFAQTASISGVVQDASGAVIPGAKVTLTDVDTGTSRSVMTDAGGRYRAPSLIPDHYEVKGEMTGFETGVRNGIQLAVGNQLEINIVLQVGQVAQMAVVTAEAPMVETLTGTVSALVDDKAIRDLPLNGRSFDQLIALEASAPVIRGAGSGSSATEAITSVGYAVSGSRQIANRFYLDGMEELQATQTNNLPGGITGINLGVEAIREYSVMTSNYSAAYGKKSGALINMVTRSGSNQFHGSVYEFLRNNDLDARNFFDHEIPPFRRNQFGGALGGPIWKDRTFFFGNYEGLRENLGLSVIEAVPDDNARQGLVRDPTTGQLINVGVAPGVKPYLAVFPLANGRNYGNGIAEAVFSPAQLLNGDFVLGRMDHRLSDNDSFFASYKFSQDSTSATSPVIYWASRSSTSNHSLIMQETRAYATTVNTVRAGFNRSTMDVNTAPTVPTDSSLNFFPGAGAMGVLNFGLGTTSLGNSGSGGGTLTTVGPLSTTLAKYGLTQFTVGDDLVLQRGPHSIQFGVVVQPTLQNQIKGKTPAGSFQFTSLTSFLQGQATSFIGPSPTGGHDDTKSFEQTYIATYIQDDYKVRRNLTLNLGLRWEFMPPPTERYGRISNYYVRVINGVSVMDSTPTLGSPFYASHKDNFAPRVGFAWDVLGDGKTSVRGGFGMFYDQLESEFKADTYGNLPYYGLVSVNNPPFPQGFSGGGGGGALPAPDAIDSNLKIPTKLQWNLNVQRQVTANTAVTIGYIGSESYYLTRRSDLNTAVPQILARGVRFYPATAQRTNPALGNTTFISTDATSSYQGLNLDVVQRLSHGLRGKVSFAYAKNIDTASAITGNFATGNPDYAMVTDNLALDRGLSSYDVRRNLVANLTYDLPWQNSTRGTARWIGGWQMSGIVTLSDGMPVTILTGFNRSQNKGNGTGDRPDLLPGASKNPVLGGPNEYFDPTVFALPQAGFFGNLGRNTLIGPGFADLDFTVAKVFPVSERLKVNFRAEFFNILNRANFGFPAHSVFATNGSILGSAGRISTTVSTSRQIQLGLKLVF